MFWGKSEIGVEILIFKAFLKLDITKYNMKYEIFVYNFNNSPFQFLLIFNFSLCRFFSPWLWLELSFINMRARLQPTISSLARNALAVIRIRVADPGILCSDPVPDFLDLSRFQFYSGVRSNFSGVSYLGSIYFRGSDSDPVYLSPDRIRNSDRIGAHLFDNKCSTRIRFFGINFFFIIRILIW